MTVATATGCRLPLAASRQVPTPLAFTPCVGVSDGELRVSVEGLQTSHGVVLIGLYDSAASFDRAIKLADKEGFLNDPTRVAGAALRTNTALGGSVVFSNLVPGRYALIVIHDENANGRLDKNFFGVPTEPYGFSNHAQGFLGPPSFDDAAIVLGAHENVAIVELIHPEVGMADAADEAWFDGRPSADRQPESSDLGRPPE